MAVTITAWDINVNIVGTIQIMRRRNGLTDPEGGVLNYIKQQKSFSPSEYADAAAMTTDMDAKISTFLAPTMTVQQITDFATELVRVAFAFYVPPEP